MREGGRICWTLRYMGVLRPNPFFILLAEESGKEAKLVLHTVVYSWFISLRLQASNSDRMNVGRFKQQFIFNPELSCQFETCYTVPGPAQLSVACKRRKAGQGLGTRLGASYVFNSPAKSDPTNHNTSKMIYHRGASLSENALLFKPQITAGFVTVCCFMTMVSKTSCSHFSGKGSCTCLDWTG